MSGPVFSPYVMPNARGGWSVIVRGKPVGNYATPEDARRAYFRSGEQHAHLSRRPALPPTPMGGAL